jgi:hypothetical protein
VLGILSDKESYECYKTIAFGTAEDYWKLYFSNLQSKTQYFDYISLDSQSVILNFGVDNGFELPYFLAYNPKLIISVDLSADNYLSPYVKECLKTFPGTNEFVPKLLYGDENGVNSPSSVTTISNIISEYKLDRIDLLKFDIEGAERNIFSEIESIVSKFRPQFAISIYHTTHKDGTNTITDLYQIPLQLYGICKDYNFFVRSYSYERWETILYCIPKERSTLPFSD